VAYGRDSRDVEPSMDQPGGRSNKDKCFTLKEFEDSQKNKVTNVPYAYQTTRRKESVQGKHVGNDYGVENVL
jgi:hypothetical protein